jgi:hypothetical protein
MSVLSLGIMHDTTVATLYVLFPVIVSLQSYFYLPSLSLWPASLSEGSLKTRLVFSLAASIKRLLCEAKGVELD